MSTWSLDRARRGLVSCAVVLLSGAAVAQDFELHRAWTIAEGMPQGSATNLQFGSEGYLWVATYGGLARFDGARFDQFELQNRGLGGGRLLALGNDAEGTLWAGTEGNGLFVHEDGAFERHDVGPEDARGSVRDFHLQGETLWFSGTSLGRVRDGQVEVLAPSPGGLLRSVAALDGERVLCSSERGLELWTAEDGWTLVEAGYFGDVLRTSDGAIWVPGDGALRTGRDPYDLRVAIEERTLGHVRFLEELDGEVWASLGRSLARIEPRRDEDGRVYRCELDRVATLEPGDYYMSLERDRHGGLWAGRAYGGLQRFREPRFTRVRRPGVVDGPIWHLRSDGRSGAFVQVGEDNFLHLDGKFRPRGSLSSDEWGLTHAAVGERFLRIGEWDLHLHDRAWRELASLEHELGTVGALEVDRDGVAWLGAQGRIDRLEGETLLPVDLGLELPTTSEGLVQSMRFAPDGALWFATPSALVRWTPGGARRWDASSGLPDAKLRAVHVRANGDVWVSSYGGGLARVRDDEVALFGRDHGLHDVYLGGIQESDDGRLFVNGNRGVQAFAPPVGDERQLHALLLETGEGNQVDSLRTPDGRLWFPTVRGLVVIDPSRVRAPLVLPRALVTRVEIEGEPAQLASRRDASLVLPPGRRTLEFRFLAPTFEQPELVRYRYALHGSSEPCRESRGPGRVAFHELPPGEYRFEVVAASPDGHWNPEGAVVHLELQPYLWETTPFRVGVGALVLLGLLVGHLVRLRTIQRHNRELRDQIEERGRAERLRRVAERQLRESTKLEGIGRLAGGIAHDFNNVLTIVLGRSTLLERWAERSRNTTAQVHAEEIRACAKHAASLTRQLLAYSQREKLPLRSVDPNASVRDVEGLLRYLLPEPVRLELDLAEGLEPVLADSSQLEQVVMNLVLNARDSMPDGGDIVVRTRRRTTPATDDGSEPRTWCSITVTDQGSGIDDESLGRIFDPFYTTKDEAGTGLGLASVHGIVAQLGGTVDVESTLGVGSTFEVLLPIASGAPAEGAQDGDPGEDRLAGLRGARVLVCDDFDPARRIIADALEACGSSVTSTCDADEALALVSAEDAPFDVLITDVVMPHRTGTDLARRAKALLPDLRVVYVSGFAPTRLDPDAVPGAFLSKPFEEHELVEVAAGVLVDEPDGWREG